MFTAVIVFVACFSTADLSPSGLIDRARDGVVPGCAVYEIHVYEERLTLMQCMMRAQAEIARTWKPYHPNEHVMSHRCEFPDAVSYKEA